MPHTTPITTTQQNNKYELANTIHDGLRIAFTDGPLVGVKIRKDLTEEMAAAYETAGLTKYANGLRNGSMVPLIPSSDLDNLIIYWEPREGVTNPQGDEMIPNGKDYA
jgi:hypothetical protein